jgi:hypothetical protein
VRVCEVYIIVIVLGFDRPNQTGVRTSNLLAWDLQSANTFFLLMHKHIIRTQFFDRQLVKMVRNDWLYLRVNAC